MDGKAELHAKARRRAQMGEALGVQGIHDGAGLAHVCLWTIDMLLVVQPRGQDLRAALTRIYVGMLCHPCNGTQMLNFRAPRLCSCAPSSRRQAQQNGCECAGRMDSYPLKDAGLQMGAHINTMQAQE